MKYIFIVQGEGRGHLTQAMTMHRLLTDQGHEVVGVLVGTSKGRKLPDFFTQGIGVPVYPFLTANFVNSKDHKHPSIFKTVVYNLSHAFSFIPSIRLIRKIVKESGADVIVNFYEMLGTLAHLTLRKVPMMVVAHQFLFLHKDLRLPRKGFEGKGSLLFLTRLVALGACKVLALSFRTMPDDPSHRIKVMPPLLRPALYGLTPSDGGYVLGYMLNAGFAEEIIRWHEAHREVPLRFFWDDRSHGDIYKVDDTLSFYYLNDREFLIQMAGCHAYASTAGFESICEAMYLGKPLMMVPSHIEQKCNAYDATLYKAAVSAEAFDLSVLYDFARTSFCPDLAFPDWVRSAPERFARELGHVGDSELPLSSF